MRRGYELSDDVNGPITVLARGRDVLASPMINRGTAFSVEDRERFGLTGLLPSGVVPMDLQLNRVYTQFGIATTPLAKNIYLSQLRDRNEVLFYRLLSDHIEEMLPIVYTPTIGEAIQRYSQHFNRSRGVFLSIDHPELIEESLENYGANPEKVDLLIITDSEGILGIGDQGVGGIQIAIGKAAVYVAAAGIHPRRVIPIALDTGTDNLGLLNDPMYLGARHGRVRGPRYDEFIERVVTTLAERYPHAMLHWEDFGARNAHPILERYRDRVCSFNDDIQGTAAVAQAAALAACSAAGVGLRNQRIVIHGAGSAGAGIGNLLWASMVADGLTDEEAGARFHACGRRGLITDAMDVPDFQMRFATPAAQVREWTLTGSGPVSLLDVVRNVKPTMLIGTSTVAGAFTEEVVREMASGVDRPIIMPMSNPTEKAEAVPADLLAWTGGKALIATGSPFAPVEYGGVRYQIAQANNALIFPGLGLGVAVCRAERVTDRMISAAAHALAGLTHVYRPGVSLLPSISNLRLVSATVAIAVAAAAAADGVARRPLTDPVNETFSYMWQPAYPALTAG